MHVHIESVVKDTRSFMAWIIQVIHIPFVGPVSTVCLITFLHVQPKYE